VQHFVPSLDVQFVGDERENSHTCDILDVCNEVILIPKTNLRKPPTFTIILD